MAIVFGDGVVGCGDPNRNRSNRRNTAALALRVRSLDLAHRVAILFNEVAGIPTQSVGAHCNNGWRSSV